MASFCYDCSIDMFGDEVTNDFAGLIDEDLVKKGYVLPVLCEGCGYIMIDHLGKKVGTSDALIAKMQEFVDWPLSRKDE